MSETCSPLSATPSSQDCSTPSTTRPRCSLRSTCRLAATSSTTCYTWRGPSRRRRCAFSWPRFCLASATCTLTASCTATSSRLTSLSVMRVTSPYQTSAWPLSSHRSRRSCRRSKPKQCSLRRRRRSPRHSPCKTCTPVRRWRGPSRCPRLQPPPLACLPRRSPPLSRRGPWSRRLRARMQCPARHSSSRFSGCSRPCPQG